MNELHVLAATWRQENGYANENGVIVISCGQVQGWVDRLRNPDHWQPGCIAVNEVGEVFIATGGNIDAGAECWEPAKIKKISAVVDQLIARRGL